MSALLEEKHSITWKMGGLRGVGQTGLSKTSIAMATFCFLTTLFATCRVSPSFLMLLLFTSMRAKCWIDHEFSSGENKTTMSAVIIVISIGLLTSNQRAIGENAER